MERAQKTTAVEANPRQTNGARRRDLAVAPALLLGCIAVAGFKLWLVAGQDLIARQNPLDQLRYLQMAETLVQGRWLGSYGPLTLIREPGYSFWVALVHELGVPLRWANETLLLLAAAAFSSGLRRAGLSRGATFACFSVVVLEPHSLVVNRDALPASFYLPGLLLAVAGLLRSALAETAARRAVHAGWTGLVLGVLWATRPEKLLLVGLLLLAAVVDFAALRRRSVARRRAAAWAALLVAVPGLGVAMVAGSIAAANHAHYGVFGTTEVAAPGYLAANRALVSIEQASPRRFVPVPREVRERAYAVSPAFRELRSTLEGPSWARNVSCRVDRVCDDIAAGYLRWLFREAVAAAGHMDRPGAADAFFQQIADELDAACRSGALACRRSFTTFLHPYPGTYLRHLGASFLRVSHTAFAGPSRYFREAAGDHPDVAPAVRRLFDEMAGRPARVGAAAGEGPAASSSAALRRRAAALLWGVHPFFYAGLTVLGACAALVLLRRQRHVCFSAPAWGALASLAFLALARFALLSFVDASSFPARSSRYVYAAVPLYGCAVLLLIDAASRSLRRLRRRANADASRQRGTVDA
jgi:hypothetical protein